MFEIKEKIKDTDKFILKNFDLDSNQSQETIISMVSIIKINLYLDIFCIKKKSLKANFKKKFFKEL